MIYKADDRRVPFMVDRYITGNFGEDDVRRKMVCCGCGGRIKSGDLYYLTGDKVYCMNCECEAVEQILENVRQEFIYQM